MASKVSFLAIRALLHKRLRRFPGSPRGIWNLFRLQ